MTDVTTLLAGIKARAEGLTDLCAEHLGQSIRHIQRNCEIDCNTHDDEKWGDCKQPGRYDGDRMADALASIPRLVAALEAVTGLHRKTSQEFITASACLHEECDCENECPVEPLPVCHHCWGQLEQIDPYFGEDHHVSEVMWPCLTITAVAAALEGEGV